MFTTEERDQVRDRIIEMAKSDRRVTAGALIGSTAAGLGDRWSDIDLTFGIEDGDGARLQQVLDDWTAWFTSELGALQHWDLPFGPSIYRVFLLPRGLEVDVSVTPQQEFQPHSPRWRTLFGAAGELKQSPPADPQNLIGQGWHMALHSRAAIERGKPWHAEYCIGALRDHTLALMCLRRGESTAYAKGVDHLPASVTDHVAAALVRSLDKPELRRALDAATTCFIAELEVWDAELCAQIKPILQEFGAVA
jgi:predicted nucleotidyltransferase